MSWASALCSNDRYSHGISHLITATLGVTSFSHSHRCVAGTQKRVKGLVHSYPTPRASEHVLLVIFVLVTDWHSRHIGIRMLNRYYLHWNISPFIICFKPDGLDLPLCKGWDEDLLPLSTYQFTLSGTIPRPYSHSPSFLLPKKHPHPFASSFLPFLKNLSSVFPSFPILIYSLQK